MHKYKIKLGGEHLSLQVQHEVCSDLCPMLSSLYLCSLLSVPCSLLTGSCPLFSALCSLLFALCSLLSAN